MAELIDRLSIRNKLYVADAITMRGVAMLNQEPSVDAVPVVRCKDCENYCEYDDFDRDRGEFFKCHDCKIFNKDLGENGFCSRGERKEQA